MNFESSVWTFGISVAACLTIMSLRSVLTRAQLGWFSFETTNGGDYKISRDIRIKEDLSVEIESIDKSCRKGLRQTLSRTVRKFIRNNPEFKDDIFAARYCLTTTICDNNIISEISTSLIGYYESLLDEASANVSNPILIEHFVREWVANVVRDVKETAREKIEAYNRSLEIMQVETNKEICRKKIQKNINYIERIEYDSKSDVLTHLSGLDQEV